MIHFEGETFDSIDQFDCVVLSFNHKGGGGYTTVLPISPLEFRRNNPSKAKVVITKEADGTLFNITDDWCHHYYVWIEDIHQEDIEKAIQHAIDLELIK